MIPNHWNSDIVCTALDSLNVFSEFIQYIGENDKNRSKHVIIQLCKYIDQELTQENLVVFFAFIF